MFGFLRKLRAPRLSQEEARKLLQLMEESSVRMIRGIKAPEGWDARGTLFTQAEFGAFIIFMVTMWHRLREEKLGANPVLLELYRSTIEAGVPGFGMYAGFNKKEDELSSNRMAIYQKSFIPSENNFMEHWADVFAYLSIYANAKRQLFLHNCESRGDVYDLLLKERIAASALDVYQLKMQFNGAMTHQYPVQVEMFQVLHGARLGKVIK